MFELRKIGFVRRASALLLDAILLAVLTTGFMFIISLICNYDHEQKLVVEYYNEWDGYRKEYAKDVSEAYGFTYKAEDEDNTEYTITDADDKAVTLDDVWNKLKDSKGVSDNPITKEAYEKYNSLTPIEEVNRQLSYTYSLLFMMISVGILLAYLVLEFVIPIILKNGQTVGKKVFGIGLVRPDCVRMTIPQLFARTVLGKFAVETMFPVLLVILFLFANLGLMAIVLFAAITILNIAVFFASKNRTPLHDVFAHTVAIDIKLQVIFQSTDEMIERKTIQHNEEVENSKNI
ncbi:MAG: RDD family protein [Clostridia bacterium]|nr:RDD family protein [Clostridia bacterium]